LRGEVLTFDLKRTPIQNDDSCGVFVTAITKYLIDKYVNDSTTAFAGFTLPEEEELKRQIIPTREWLYEQSQLNETLKEFLKEDTGAGRDYEVGEDFDLRRDETIRKLENNNDI